MLTSWKAFEDLDRLSAAHVPVTISEILVSEHACKDDSKISQHAKPPPQRISSVYQMRANQIVVFNSDNARHERVSARARESNQRKSISITGRKKAL